jgi:linoleoyl-CoA desaturase
MGEKISQMAKYESYIGLMLRFMFLMRFYVIPLYLYPSLYTFLNILLTLTVGGFYLGINFIISHNFEGVKNYDDNGNGNANDWAISQIETSSTVGGRLLGYFHGGLNYQIEHHLFPRISHVHYHKIKPIVQAWCKENKIKYNYYNNLFDNIRACYIHLQKYGEAST